MSVLLMPDIWELELGRVDMVVLLALADCAYEHGGSFPELRYLAWQTGYTEPTIRYRLRRLWELGVLVPLGVPDSGGGYPNASGGYAIDLSRIPHKQPYTRLDRLGVASVGPLLQVGPAVGEISQDWRAGDPGPAGVAASLSSDLQPGSLARREGGLARVRKTTPGREAVAETRDVTLSKVDGRTVPITRPVPKPPNTRPISQYLTELIHDFSRELGDLDHYRENVSQALRLWRGSGLTEDEFGLLCHRMKRATRKHQARPVYDPLRNKMAYFFAALRNEVTRLSELPETYKGEQYPA